MLPLIVIIAHLGCTSLSAQATTPHDSLTLGVTRVPLSLRKAPHWPPADPRIRAMALSGAAIGGVAGTVIGFNARCQDSAKHTWCKVDDAVIGLGAGMFAGNTIGAWAGGGRTRCGELEGFARSTAGALIGSVPFTAYMIALHNKRTNYYWPVFFLSITLPFFQAEGATRAVSGC